MDNEPEFFWVLRAFAGLVLGILFLMGGMLALAGCASAPPRTVVLERKVPVPVLCDRVIYRPKLPNIREVDGKRLAEQNRLFRLYIAGLSGYVMLLEPTAAACGVTVKGL